MKKPLTPDAALERLEELCSRSEQCTDDVRRKLYRWQIEPDEADRIVDSLIDNRFVDDARFARAFVRDRYRFAGWGRRKIRAALAVKRIPSSTVSEAMDEIDGALYQRKAFAALQAKLHGLDRSDPRACREKLLRFGLSRGYETDLVIRIIESRRLWQQDTER